MQRRKITFCAVVDEDLPKEKDTGLYVGLKNDTQVVYYGVITCRIIWL